MSGSALQYVTPLMGFKHFDFFGPVLLSWPWKPQFGRLRRLARFSVPVE